MKCSVNQDCIDNQIFEYGSKHGWSEPAVKFQMLNEGSRLWESVIKRQAISGDVAGAHGTYQEQRQKGAISGQVQGEIEEFLKPYQDLSEAQRAFGVATGGSLGSQIVSEAQRQGVDPNPTSAVGSFFDVF
jgi:hypothetical protein